MATHVTKYVAVYATYSEVFGDPFDREELKRMIGSLPWGAVLNVAAQMLARPIGSEHIAKAFWDSCRSLGIDEDTIELLNQRYENRILVHAQGLLTVCKWLLAYGDPANFRLPADTHWAIGITVYLCTIVSDYLVTQEADPVKSSRSLAYEMVRNAVFNATEHPYLALARTNYIYMTLGADKSLYEPKEYVDYTTEFEKKYGYDIQEYLSVLFGLIALSIETPDDIVVGWSRDVDHWYSETDMATMAGDIAREQMAVSVEDAQAWALKTVDSPWDFSLFQERPLILIEGAIFFPLYPKFLSDQVFHGLFHKIRRCYPQTDPSFNRFFGRPFEEYVKLLVRQAVDVSPLPYQFIDEFKYFTTKGEERSPDVMIRLGTRLLAIEAKAMRMRFSGVAGGSTATIDEDLERMVAEPLKQAHDRLVELMTLPSGIDFSGVDEIYLLAVTMGEFPTMQPLERRLLDKLNNYYKLPIRGSYHLDIEEFEYLCSLLSGKRPIFRALNNKTKLEPFQSFKTFLHSTRLPRKRPKFVDEKAEEFITQVQRRLFPEVMDDSGKSRTN